MYRKTMKPHMSQYIEYLMALNDFKKDMYINIYEIRKINSDNLLFLSRAH